MRRACGAVLALCWVAVASWAASKPDGGICTCSSYVEMPVLCGSLAGAARGQCVQSNMHWLDQCSGWRDQMCRSAPSRASVPLQSLAPVDPSLPKYTGSWSGKTACRKLGGWRMSMTVKQQSDGSFVTNASMEGAGEVTDLTFKGETVSLLYKSWFKDTSYTGRLVSPGRIEGTARINTEDCQWFLARQN